MALPNNINFSAIIGERCDTVPDALMDKVPFVCNIGFLPDGMVFSMAKLLLFLAALLEINVTSPVDASPMRLLLSRSNPVSPLAPVPFNVRLPPVVLIVVVSELMPKLSLPLLAELVPVRLMLPLVVEISVVFSLPVRKIPLLL